MPKAAIAKHRYVNSRIDTSSFVASIARRDTTLVTVKLTLSGVGLPDGRRWEPVGVRVEGHRRLQQVEVVKFLGTKGLA